MISTTLFEEPDCHCCLKNGSNFISGLQTRDGSSSLEVWFICCSVIESEEDIKKKMSNWEPHYI